MCGNDICISMEGYRIVVQEEDMEARRIVDQVGWHRVVKNFPPSYDVPQLYFVFSQKNV